MGVAPPCVDTAPAFRGVSSKSQVCRFNPFFVGDPLSASSRVRCPRDRRGIS